MTSYGPEGDLASLQFSDAVNTFIQPLLLEYGFVQIEDKPQVARFASPSVNFAIQHEPYSFEIDILVNYKNTQDRGFTLQDIVDADGGNESTFFQASSSDRMFQCVASISQILKRYGSSVLRGDAKAFAMMAEVSGYRNQEYTNDVVQRPIREAAELAWKQKQYKEVKRLYEAITGSLTPLEEKRLAYATGKSR